MLDCIWREQQQRAYLAEHGQDRWQCLNQSNLNAASNLGIPLGQVLHEEIVQLSCIFDTCWASTDLKADVSLLKLAVQPPSTDNNHMQ